MSRTLLELCCESNIHPDMLAQRFTFGVVAPTPEHTREDPESVDVWRYDNEIGIYYTSTHRWNGKSWERRQPNGELASDTPDTYDIVVDEGLKVHVLFPKDSPCGSYIRVSEALKEFVSGVLKVNPIDMSRELVGSKLCGLLAHSEPLILDCTIRILFKVYRLGIHVCNEQSGGPMAVFTCVCPHGYYRQEGSCFDEGNGYTAVYADEFRRVEYIEHSSDAGQDNSSHDLRNIQADYVDILVWMEKEFADLFALDLSPNQ